MLLRETNIPFEPSSLKTNLDALMVTLNAVHDKDVFEYQIDRTSHYVLSERWWRVEYWWICNTRVSQGYGCTVTPVTSDQGDVIDLQFMNQVKQTSGTANGTQGVATTAT